MKHLIYIFSFAIILISCNNDFKENGSGNNTKPGPTEYNSFDTEFVKWLNESGFENDDIVDTTIEKAFELWGYSGNLNSSDSAYYWYPSRDSSFYLITNYNFKTKKRSSIEHSNGIELKFLKRSTNEVFNGLMLMDSLAQRSVDVYWYDSSTFYFLERIDKGDEAYLTKLKMGVDTIWTYKIKR